MKLKRRSSFGWVELIVGMLFIVFGIHAFANPSIALTSIVIIYGALAIVGGISDILFYVRLERHTPFGPTASLVSGIISIILGVLLLLNIGAGAWALTLLFPIWFIIHCISRLANLGFVRRNSTQAHFIIAFITNIIGLILGCMLLINPFASALSMVYLVGIYSILTGAGAVTNAFSRLGE